MIEIAISLAVIGFALVAIIGILPTGLDVQKQNKEETIINQDASVLVEAVRNGAQGADDLTNYIYSITKYSTVYNPPNPPSATRVDVYTPTSATYPINNGYRIIGLLSTPKYTYDDPLNPPPAYTSNYVVALARSMSGAAFDKFPQDNTALQDAAFKYRLISEVTPYYATDPSWIDPGSPAYQGVTYTNLVRHREVNLYDVRLIFRWPVLPNGNIGNSRLVFRTQASGSVTNELTGFKIPRFAYFFESRNYVKAAP
jgi:type II secretory pathway pseudopilin PulG